MKCTFEREVIHAFAMASIVLMQGVEAVNFAAPIRHHGRGWNLNCTGWLPSGRSVAMK